MALRGCNLRFRRRFHEMERTAEKPLEELEPEELEVLWAAAKKKLNTPEPAR
jgi:XTP/dITP diphosphohydrolase/ATP diphosphatase